MTEASKDSKKAPATLTMGRDEARSLTDEVKHDAERLWRKLVGLYEGGAHTALGYPSWGAYYKAEFGGSQRRGYQLLEAGRVMGHLEPVQHVALPANDRQARELVPLLGQPDEMRAVWVSVVESNPEPTAVHIKEAVERHRENVTVMQSYRSEKRGQMTTRQLQVANKAKHRLFEGMGMAHGVSRVLVDINFDIVAAVTTHEELKAQKDLARRLAAAFRKVESLIDAADEKVA